MVTRRSFIKSTAVVSAAVLAQPIYGFSPIPRKSGLALYTIRDEMGKDPALALEKVAGMGYNWVESAGYGKRMFYGMAPEKFSSLCSSFGLEHISAHLGINESNLEIVAEDAAKAGIKYGVLPSLPGKWSSDIDGFKKAASFMNKAGNTFNRVNTGFAFHNHSVEFRPIAGIIPFDVLLAETDQSTVTFELDVCWIKAAGIDAAHYLAANPGRFKLWHIKDMSVEKRDATLGEGVIDFKPIFALEKISRMDYFFIEQDNCTTHTTLESVEISRNYLFEKIF